MIYNNNIQTNFKKAIMILSSCLYIWKRKYNAEHIMNIIKIL